MAEEINKIDIPAKKVYEKKSTLIGRIEINYNEDIKDYDVSVERYLETYRSEDKETWELIEQKKISGIDKSLSELKLMDVRFELMHTDITDIIDNLKGML